MKKKINNNSRNRSNSKRKVNSNNSTSTKKRFDSEMNSGEFNDVSWYTLSPEFTKASANLAFSYGSGAKLPQLMESFTPTRMPGIMTLFYAPTPMVSSDEASTLNVMSNALYSYVRHANSGHTNYDAPDLMTYIIAMDSLYSFHAWMTRLYGLIRSYNVYNRYTPKYIVEALGVDYDDLSAKAANFQQYINTFAAKCGAFVTPNGMTYSLRHLYLNSNVFTDSASSKSQYYVFRPEYFFRYSPVSTDTGAELVPATITASNTTTGLLTVEDIIEFGESILAPISASEDLHIMSGDILKAFGDDVVKFTFIDESFQVIPVHSLEILTQIQNADIVFMNRDADTAKIVQNETGSLLYKPVAVNAELKYYSNFQIFTLPFDNPSPENVIEGSRLMAFIKDDGSGTITTCGTEIITLINLVTINHDGTKREVSVGSYLNVEAANVATTVDVLWLLSQFDFHPGISIQVNANSGKYVGPMIDTDNYTVMSESDLRQINNAVLMRLFATKQIALRI